QAALMSFRDPEGYGQAKAGAACVAIAARPRLIRTEKALEDAGLEVERDTRAGVCDPQKVRVLLAPAIEGDYSAGGRVLDGVVEKVQQHAAEQVFVGLYRQFGLNRGGEGNTFGDGQ